MTSPLNKRKFAYRGWLLLLLLLLLASGGSYIWLQPEPSDDKAQQRVEVVVGDIEENVTAQGKLEPKEYVDVGAQVTGQLQKLYVDIGDDVKLGQLLVEIDPRVYAARVQADEANIKNLQAQLAGQQANVVFARQQYERNRELMKTKGVSEQDFKNSEFN